MSDEQPRADLLGGPRGRRLCLSFLMLADPSLGVPAFAAAYEQSDNQRADRIAELAAAVARVAPETAGSIGEPELLRALVETTSSARYWQEPDEMDALLENRQLRAALDPIATAIAGAAETAWWSTSASHGDHQHVQWVEWEREPPALTGARSRLDKWRESATATERRALEWPDNLAAPISDAWWSIPAFANLAVTTRSVPGAGALKLLLVEDSMGWTKAIVWPLTPRSDSRLYEITGPAAWTDLVARFPMDVTCSRRHDWWRFTGHEGSWLIPDWRAVASAYDGVHLTVTGYLTTAGRALPAGDAHTMLAGWSPDETYWLGDVLQPAGPPVEWHRAVGGEAWTRG